MWDKFCTWCSKERLGRVEEGTSQDMCSTNGDRLTHFCVCLFMALCLGAALLVRAYF
jgi:hypothetical protein